MSNLQVFPYRKTLSRVEHTVEELERLNRSLKALDNLPGSGDQCARAILKMKIIEQQSVACTSFPMAWIKAVKIIRELRKKHHEQNRVD